MEPSEAISNIQERVKPKLEEYANQAQKLYDDFLPWSDINSVLDNALAYVNNEFCEEMYGEKGPPSWSYKTRIDRDEYHHFPDLQYIYKLVNDRSVQMKNLTVGQLRGMLSNYSNDLPVSFMVWESCWTDSGTDMGGEKDHAVGSIYDLETRLEIILSRENRKFKKKHK